MLFFETLNSSRSIIRIMWISWKIRGFGRKETNGQIKSAPTGALVLGKKVSETNYGLSIHVAYLAAG